MHKEIDLRSKKNEKRRIKRYFCRKFKGKRKKLEERKHYFVHLCKSYKGLFPRVDPLSDEFEAAFSGLLEAQKELM